MNPIQNLYTDLLDDELLILIDELAISEETGSFPMDAKIRDLCKKTAQITGMDISSNLMIVQIGVLKESAFRWKALQESIKNYIATHSIEPTIKNK